MTVDGRNVVGQIMAYEDGELSYEETVELFAELVRSGLAWTLQGTYGRQARYFIQNGVISETGEVM